MRKLIELIIKDSEQIGFENSTYEPIFIKEKYNTYYLFMFLNNKQDLITVIPDTIKIADMVKNNQNYQIDMDKNVTCIFCLQVTDEEYYQTQDTNTISKLSKDICDIEEDLNYFKKNVLLYTEDMFKFVNNNNLDFKTLCEQYFTKEKFEEFKKDANKNYEYDLLSNIFIKVPFLNFHQFQTSKDEKKFNTLDSFIELELKENNVDKKYIDDLVVQIEKTDTEEDFYEWLDKLISADTDKEE